MGKQGSAAFVSVDPEVRAARACTCTEQGSPCNSSECRFSRAAQAVRSEASVRAEEAYRDWSREPDVERPLARARPTSAAALFAVLREYEVSRLRLADMLGIDEKTVRQWLAGEKPIPLAAVLAMPADMGTSLLERLVDARAGGGRTVARAVPALREAVARIDVAKATPAERLQLVKALMDVQARLGELMREAMG